MTFASLFSRFYAHHGCREAQTFVARSSLLLAALTVGLLSSYALTSLAAPPKQAQDKKQSKESTSSNKEKVSAKQVLASVQSFYNRTKSLEAKFKQEYVHRLYQKKSRSQGRVTFKKPGKMRWEYEKPNGKVIVSNGKKLRMYEPADVIKGKKQGGGTLIEKNMSAQQLPVAFSFLTGSGKLQEDFNYRLLKPKKGDVKEGHILELRPKKAQPGIERMLFVVGDGKTKGVVKRVVIIDPAGNFNSLSFLASTFRFNRQVSNQQFEFSAPAGASVVEM